MPYDAAIPPDWHALHDTAWTAGWSLAASTPGYRAGWRYAATRRDGLGVLAWPDAAAVRAWIAGGCIARMAQLSFSFEEAA